MNQARVWGVTVACLSVGLARSMMLILPFERLSVILGHSVDPRVAFEAVSGRPDGRVSAARIGSCLRIASRRLPFKVSCLCESLAASMLLSLFRLPSETTLGVTLGTDARSRPGGFSAHSWTMSGTTLVTTSDGKGYQSTARYRISPWFGGASRESGSRLP